MLASDFSYALPEELIAQEPSAQRDQSRLLIVDRGREAIEHRKFLDIVDYLRDDDLMVLNDTRVVATRLHGFKETGGKVEALMMKRLEPGVWEAMVKPARRIGVGARLIFDRSLTAEVVSYTEEGGRVLRLAADSDPDELVAAIGQVPLPPYIHKRLDDPGRYQTIYAASDGSAAAPTAGLHFTPAVLRTIESKGIKMAFVTLHIGIATFRPVRTERIEDHQMHTEDYEISEASAEMINTARGRIVCVGTTTARALESAAVTKRQVGPGSGSTGLFIRPPYDFKIVEALITNFHIPKSTLLILISALAGNALIQKAYEEAVREKYRFLSFGDAMFIC